MSTRKVKIRGTFMYPKVFEDNRDMKGFEGAYEEHEGAYTIEVIMDDESFQRLKDSGSMKKGRETEEGEKMVKFTRKHKDRFDWASGAPEVFRPDKEPWNFVEDGDIHNGSTGYVELAVYDTSRSSIKGTRLEKVFVEEVTEPTPKEDTGF